MVNLSDYVTSKSKSLPYGHALQGVYSYLYQPEKCSLCAPMAEQCEVSSANLNTDFHSWVPCG